MKIGIFDSGIGGLSVLHEAYHMLNDTEYIFYADTDHVPYGTKTPDEIRTYSEEIVKFLISKGCQAIIIACNTATSVSAKKLRELHHDIPIIGMEPAVKPAIEENDERRILVMATPVTLREAKLKNLIARVDEKHKVDLLPMPGLVSLAENEDFSPGKVLPYLTQQFEGFSSRDYSALVLGCTHFNYFKAEYRNFFNDSTSLIDGNKGTLRHVADLLSIELNKDEDKELIFKDINEMLDMTHTSYYFSGRPAQESELGHIFRLHKRLEKVRKI